MSKREMLVVPLTCELDSLSAVLALATAAGRGGSVSV